MKTAIAILLMMISAGLTGCDSIKRWTEPGCQQWVDGNTADPFKLLNKSGCFRIGGVGVAARTPPEEIALFRLMKQKDSSVVLEKLFSEGTPAGQLYALLGLRFIDRAKYEKLISQVKQDSHEIETQTGCIVDRGTMRQIVKSIEAGDFDIYVQRLNMDDYQ